MERRSVIKIGCSPLSNQLSYFWKNKIRNIWTRVFQDQQPCDCLPRQTLQELFPSFSLERILGRGHCRLLGGYVVKDLTVLGRDLRCIVLVDDRAQSFLLQPDNGIPISTWVNDPDDRTLLQQLFAILERLHGFP
jgi:hypothetical protein